MTEPFLSIRHVKKSFGPTTVVEDFNLDVNAGEFISFLGPSGCGKTTVLRMVAGFEEPTAGSIAIGGKDITRLKPNQRNVGMVFQAYALFPNLTVAQNVAFGLKAGGVSRAETEARVAEMLALIHLPDFGARHPYQLSGGQQQRVALARALAPKPKLLLLDEPLSALDAKVRVSLRAEIRAIQQRLGITTIFVTHDQEEALSISDRIAVMYEGRAEQVGTPFEIYNRPTTRFVASFVGTLNIFDAEVRDATSGRIVIDGQEIVVPRGIGEGAGAGRRCSVALRPEAVSLNGIGGNRNRLDGTIEDVNFLGSVVRVRVRFKESAVSLDTFNNPNTPPPRHGEKVTVSFAPEDVLVLEGEPAPAAH
jgi:putative spermidine/putrescine transport system ATP-binding protein